MSPKHLLIGLPLGALLLALAWGWYADSRIPSPLEEARHLPPAPPPASPADPLGSAWFGELHLHTAFSVDANIFGTDGGPRAAYRFARGEPLELPASGITQRLAVPLDFAAVTDHAEGFGLMQRCYTKGSGAYWSVGCVGVRHRILMTFPRLFRSLRQDGTEHARYDETVCGPGGEACIDAARDVWKLVQEAAADYYAPGVFTTFNAFEFSPTLAEGGMLHRNVIFRGAAVPPNVFNSQDGFAEDLLRWLEADCRGECQALSIPHNPNFSWGLAFANLNSDGTPLTRENAELRARMETSVEIFQAKGSSECAAGVGGNDEQCGFENLWPACSAVELAVNPRNGQHSPRCVGPGSLVRSALTEGLAIERRLGVNPFRFGIVAASDNHNATPGDTAEDGWNGHGGVNDSSAAKRLGIERDALSKVRGREPAVTNPGGLAGVWAPENTREAIWDALRRRESFGTSGTRIRVRMFAGFGLPTDLHLRSDGLATAHALAVPMGGELQAAGDGGAPALVVWALRDPRSAPLQRIQVVKGWATDGDSGERVYDVACSDGIEPDPLTRRCADNGASVAPESCETSADRGAAELATTWTDPDFDPRVAAYYYVRVLENPVCRYSQRDALALGVEHPANVPQTVQERAWSSPVWYRPGT